MLMSTKPSFSESTYLLIKITNSQAGDEYTWTNWRNQQEKCHLVSTICSSPNVTIKKNVNFRKNEQNRKIGG